MIIPSKTNAGKVANLVLEGLSNKQIADTLAIKEKTVKYHLTKLYQQSEVSSRSEFIVKFYKNSRQVASFAANRLTV